MKNNNQIHRNVKHQLMLTLLVVSIIQACSVKRFIPENELLYTGAHIEMSGDSAVDNTKTIQSEIEGLMRPEPNAMILGARLGLLVHYKSQSGNSGFLMRFLNKRIGEKPVYLSTIKREKTEHLIVNRLENRGFFNSSVNSRVNEKVKKKQAGITYSINLTQPYVL